LNTEDEMLLTFTVPFIEIAALAAGTAVALSVCDSDWI
jgi:hypothetical protein